MQTITIAIGLRLHRMLGIYRKISYICLTEFNRQKLLQSEYIDSEKIYVKPNFTFDYHIEKKENEGYLFIGRIEEEKGISVILDAFSKIPNKKIWIVGTGTKLSYYKEKYKRYSNIEFLGQLEREEINFLLSKTKAVIANSQWYEAFGMVAIESFAAKCPVISGDLGNIKSMVEEEINGMVFRHDSAEDLVKTIIDYESTNKEHMNEGAYQSYLQKYSPEKNYLELKKIYDELIKTK